MQVLYRVYIYWGRHCNKQTTTHTLAHTYHSIPLRLGSIHEHRNLNTYCRLFSHFTLPQILNCLPLLASSQMSLQSTSVIDDILHYRIICLLTDMFFFVRSFFRTYVRSITCQLAGLLASSISLSLPASLSLSFTLSVRVTYVCITQRQCEIGKHRMRCIRAFGRRRCLSSSPLYLFTAIFGKGALAKAASGRYECSHRLCYYVHSVGKKCAHICLFVC